MSYILDSLKKSEQQRHKGDVPGLQHEPLGPRHSSRRKRPVWPYLVFAGLCLNALLLAWWFGLFSGEKKASDQVPQPLPAAATAPKETLSAPSPRSQAAAPAEAPMATQATQTPPAAEKAETKPVPPAPSLTKPLPSAPPETVLAKESPKAVPRLFLREELPQEVRKNLPPLDIALHYYAQEPASRMVRIDGRNLREGRWLDQDLQLVEIMPDGVVLRASGYDFWVPRP